MSLTPAQHQLICHSLGLSKSSKHSYRNYFCSGPGCSDMPIIEELIAAGLMCFSHHINGGSDSIFNVTEKGQEMMREFGALK